MNLYKKIPKIVFLSFCFVATIEKNPSTASTIKIINHSRAPLEINVVNSTDGKPYCKKCLLSEEIRGKNLVKIIIPNNAFKGSTYFSIVDISHGFLGNGKCKNLNVHKNYEVSFFETTLGTRCRAKEI
jgi:hypothetical protein